MPESTRPGARAGDADILCAVMAREVSAYADRVEAIMRGFAIVLGLASICAFSTAIILEKNERSRRPVQMTAAEFAAKYQKWLDAQQVAVHPR